MSDEYLDLRWLRKMLECCRSGKDVFDVLNYRVEIRPVEEDEDEDRDYDENKDEDDQGAKSVKDDKDDERPNYVFIYDPPKLSNEQQAALVELGEAHAMAAQS